MKYSAKIVAFLLALCMLSVSFFACGDPEEPVLSYKEYTLPDYVYRYWTATYKSYVISGSVEAQDTPEFWNSLYQGDQTYAEYCKEVVDGAMRKLLVGLYLFDAYDLALSDALLESIAEDIEEKEKYRGEEFFRDLENIGITKKQLENIYILQERFTAVKDYLVGENGQMSATEADLENYYQENFLRLKCMVLHTDRNMVKQEDGSFVSGSALSETEQTTKKALASQLTARVNSGENFETLLTQYGEADYTEIPNGLHFDTKNLGSYYDLYSENFIDGVEKLATSNEKCLLVEDGSVSYIMYRYDTVSKRSELTDTEKLLLADLEDFVNDERFVQVLAPLARNVEALDTLQNLDFQSIAPNKGYNM